VFVVRKWAPGKFVQPTIGRHAHQNERLSFRAAGPGQPPSDRGRQKGRQQVPPTLRPKETQDITRKPKSAPSERDHWVCKCMKGAAQAARFASASPVGAILAKGGANIRERPGGRRRVPAAFVDETEKQQRPKP